MRRLFGNLLALIGAAAIVVNVWQPWYRHVEGRHIDVGFLFGGKTYLTDDLWHSLFVAALVVAALAMLGLLAQSKALFALAGLAGVAVAVLWVVFRARANGDVGLQGGDFQVGLWGTFAAGVALWFAAALAPGKKG